MENEMMPEKYRQIARVTEPREFVTSDGWESIQLYADAFMLEREDVLAMMGMVDRMEREKNAKRE